MQAYKRFHYLSIEEAHELIKRMMSKKAKQEEVPVYQAFNRVLAEDIISEVNVPPYNVSHFDGYAIKAEDVEQASVNNPVLLKVVGRSFLGEEFEGEINAGEAAYVSTGCKLPFGANAVIPVEQVAAKGKFIEVRYSVKPYENVVPVGSDVKKGEKVFSAGHVLRAQDIKFLLDIKKWKIKVFKKPLVAIISIGNELTNRIDESDKKKFDSHSLMISHLVNEAFGVPLYFGIALDNVNDVKQLLVKCLEKADIVATIGGASVGERDYVWEAANQIGTPTAVIRGIKVQPGRVTSLVMLNDKPIVMLPGHIQSTLVGFYFVLLPIIRLMSGTPSIMPHLTLKAAISRRVVVREFLSFKRVRFVKVIEKDGGYIAEPVIGDSSLTRVIVKSNGFIVMPEGKDVLEEGEEVKVYLFHGIASG